MIESVQDFPQRLHHKTPAWVREGSLFHVRLRAAPDQLPALTTPELARPLLESAIQYHARAAWWCEWFLLMPDHLHALLRFPREPGMSVVIRNWKRGAARMQGGKWQENYFDHRLRSKAEAQEKWLYIRRNPVGKGLCATEDEWPHWRSEAR